MLRMRRICVFPLRQRQRVTLIDVANANFGILGKPLPDLLLKLAVDGDILSSAFVGVCVMDFVRWLVVKSVETINVIRWRSP